MPLRVVLPRTALREDVGVPRFLLTHVAQGVLGLLLPVLEEGEETPPEEAIHEPIAPMGPHQAAPDVKPDRQLLVSLLGAQLLRVEDVAAPLRLPQLNRAFRQLMHRVVLDLVAPVGKDAEYFGEGDILVGLFADLVVGVELPLVKHDCLDTGLAYLQARLLFFRHVQLPCLSKAQLGLNLQLLEEVQALLQL